MPIRGALHETDLFLLAAPTRADFARVHPGGLSIQASGCRGRVDTPSGLRLSSFDEGHVRTIEAMQAANVSSQFAMISEVSPGP